MQKLPLLLASTLTGILALMTPAKGNTLTADYLLPSNGPLFDRPTEGTPPSRTDGSVSFHYAVQPFFVSARTSFTLSTTAATLDGGAGSDTFLVLYQNAFNPASALTNALSANDDGGDPGTGLSSITYTLDPGVQYYGVFMTFTRTIAGTETGSFDAGNATVTFGNVVPEPSAWAALCVGAGMLGVALRHRRNTVKAPGSVCQAVSSC